MSSTRSLGALPPKQVLALALMEKAKRVKARQALEEARRAARVRAEESDSPPVASTQDSLVLDRNHPISDLYYKKARYKIYWGGRGAVKSWGAAEALIRLSASAPLRILCVREFQNSIKDSAHKLLKDTITRLGLDSWFTVTEKTIVSRSGAEFIFKGMHNNEQGIRSTEGIDICWVEEGQSVSAASWRALSPTIRKAGSEIWVTYNLVNEEDATHQRFVNPDGSPKRADSIVHKISYLDNPYFPGSVLEQEMIDDRNADYELYEHVWLGMPQKRSSAIIFNGKYVVEPFSRTMWDDIESNLKPRLHFGADFGFGDDPSTLVRSFVLPDPRSSLGKLYIDYAVFGKHVDTEDLPALYDLIPGSRDWPIKGDASRPETISALGRRGFIISAAEKWDGSVKDGIAYLRSFAQIVIRQPDSDDHPTVIAGLKSMAQEAYMYRYKTDPKAVDEKGQPLVLPIVVDKFNHGWDAERYAHDGHIQRSGAIGMWERLGAKQ